MNQFGLNTAEVGYCLSYGQAVIFQAFRKSALSKKFFVSLRGSRLNKITLSLQFGMEFHSWFALRRLWAPLLGAYPMLNPIAKDIAISRRL
jgi:hypothetical protein